MTAMAIFKAYDIRGIVPDELDAKLAYRIGRATAHFIGAGPIAVGRDARVHSPELTRALIDGIRDEGIDVVDLGLVATPMLYFGVEAVSAAAGVMVTRHFETFDASPSNTPYGQRNRQYGRPMKMLPTRKTMPVTTMNVLPLNRKIGTNGSYWQMMNPPPVAAKIIARPRYTYASIRNGCSSQTGSWIGFNNIKSCNAPCGQTDEQKMRPKKNANTSGNSPNAIATTGTAYEESARPRAMFWMLPMEQMQPFRQKPK